jgi:hypothetical protein
MSVIDGFKFPIGANGSLYGWWWVGADADFQVLKSEVVNPLDFLLQSTQIIFAELSRAPPFDLNREPPPLFNSVESAPIFNSAITEYRDGIVPAIESHLLQMTDPIGASPVVGFTPGSLASERLAPPQRSTLNGRTSVMHGLFASPY